MSPKLLALLERFVVAFETLAKNTAPPPGTEGIAHSSIELGERVQVRDGIALPVRPPGWEPSPSPRLPNFIPGRSR